MNTNVIGADAYRAALALPDLTDVAYGVHAMQSLLQSVIERLRGTWAAT